jgi:colicin import membrane protein
VIAQKDTETERRLAELKIKSLEEIVVRQAEEIKSLTARVEESKTQVQEIAIKAIESTSGARALSHINQIAMEQAKTRSSTQS